ncbi:MAG TPA: hypothetical protein VFA11_06120 [Acidimicrobiales bacterium]|nr:hypothetical protein [Acidimicrobiales bacterium]
MTDPPALWEDLGFAVEGGTCHIGSVRVDLGATPPEGASTGIAWWTLSGLGGPADLDGLPTRLVDGDGPPDPASASHPNGAVAIDHIVVSSPRFERTVELLQDAGLLLRRRRSPDGARPMSMAFFRIGETILEVVEAGGDGPPRFWGLAITVGDIEATAALLGDRLRPVRPALQPGRSIATVDRACGSSVELAFMSQPGTA